MAALCAMSPLKEVPADLHLLDAAQAGKLRVTDPLKSFVKAGGPLMQGTGAVEMEIWNLQISVIWIWIYNDLCGYNVKILIAKTCKNLMLQQA